MGVEVVEALEWEHTSDRAKDSDAGDQVFEALERRRSLRAQTSPISVRHERIVSKVFKKQRAQEIIL
jgi:hypothetical protein